MPDVDVNFRGLMIDDLRRGRRPVEWSDISPVPRRIAPEKQIRWGSYGDSISVVSTATGQDIRTYTSGFLQLTATRMGGWIGHKSNGLLRCVFSGGVSGETTTQMIARESAGASSTRRALLDAASCGVEYLIWSAGINDIQTLAAGASQATIDGVIATAMTNLKALFNKARSLGMMTIFPSLLPYSAGSASQNVTRNIGITQFNAAMSVFLSANPALGYYIDVKGLLTAADGGWKVGYSDDGLHPNHNGCAVYCPPIADLIITLHGGARYQFALPAFPVASINCFDNADLSGVSAGVATRITLNGSYQGTGSVSGQQIVQINGVNFQEFKWTAATFDVNGNAACSVDIVVPIFGASPYVAISNGDLLAAEADCYVDDGSGGAPVLTQYFMRFQIVGTVGLFMDSPTISPTYVGPNYVAPLDVHAFTLPTTAGEASATMTNCLLKCAFYTKTAGPMMRVRIGNIRVIKLPAGYA